ncbi:glycosyltransferase family 2 protein [Fibrella aquatilis]|uniref:Glycosyltransferase n=1 Tax=Fibrella aquatilis TaxID=2817059 RepID=A0A939G8G3_9BACT|nr:glycosyltransferase family 2 protein [Fibrella aquatilis]MBO0931713.1 glycosyltransferase [Fibrella aquatilis]
MPDRPRVSVLVAARNEAVTIEACLCALAALDGSFGGYEVLVGNDDSTDQTARLTADFIADKPHFRLFNIPPGDITRLNGKARVLAELARHATGEFLFITDADVRVPPTWLAGMLAEFGPETGIVTGTTLVAGRSVGARLQALDWLLAFGLIDLGTTLRLPLTGSGNNMALRWSAYDAVGGFEGLPFSVVEDYTLFQAIVAKGFRFGHRLQPDVLAETLPAPTLRAFLQQRKRWMRGAFSLPPLLVVGVLVQYLLVPFLLLLALLAPKIALFIYLAKLTFQSTLLLRTLRYTHQKNRWPDIFLFEPYLVISSLACLVYYLLPVGIRWKEREYASA